jgi:hypothetical protein
MIREGTRVYEVINPSDAITFRATPEEAAVIAIRLYESLIFVKDVETGKDPSEGFSPEHLARLHKEVLGDAMRPGYAAAWRSFLVGAPHDRGLFEHAIEKLAPNDATEFAALWHDQKRTSLNDICKHAWDNAARIDAWNPDGGDQ